MGISVALITHNRASFLNACLQSLAQQIRLPDEVIIVDNGSTDSTKIVSESFRPVLPIKYYFNKRVGYSSNRNFALKKCTYNTIAWIDDDCTAFPDWLVEIEKSLRIGMYLFQGVDVDDKQNIFSYVQNLRTEEFRYFSEQLLNYRVEISRQTAKKIFGVDHVMTFHSINSVDHRSFVYRKEILNRLPFWFDDGLPPYFSADEWDILRRIRNAGFYVLLNPRIRVVHHGRSTFKAFMIRQIQYGKNDAIREWLDKDRRKKVARLRSEIHSRLTHKFFYTHRLWLQANVCVIRDILRDDFTFIIKTAILGLYIAGKILRYGGKIYEQATNNILHTRITDRFYVR